MKIDEYASWCVLWEGQEFTQGASWAAHLQNMGLDLLLLAS